MIRHYVTFDRAKDALIREGFWSVGPQLFLNQKGVYASVHFSPGTSYVAVIIAPAE